MFKKIRHFAFLDAKMRRDNKAVVYRNSRKSRYEGDSKTASVETTNLEATTCSMAKSPFLYKFVKLFSRSLFNSISIIVKVGVVISESVVWFVLQLAVSELCLSM